jgi:integral membrane sensor domain MASE1
MLLDPEFHPKSDRIFMLRRYLVAVLFITAYILLDRSTVYFQIWSEISAWYPPTGLGLAFLLGMGLRYAPLYFLAGFIASKVNYHVSIFSFSFPPVNTVVMGGYTAAAYLLRRVFKIDWRLRSIRDVMALLLVSLPASAIVAALGTLALVYDHRIPAAGYFDAALNWWIGDVVSIACVTPFLVFVLPA